MADEEAGFHRTHLHQYATIHNAGSHSCQHTVILQTSLTVQAATAADTQQTHNRYSQCRQPQLPAHRNSSNIITVQAATAADTQ